MKSAAFRSAISYKVRNNELLVLDKVALEAAKTKYVAKSFPISTSTEKLCLSWEKRTTQFCLRAET